MIAASLKMVVLLLALVAGGFAMRDAASASQAVPPCHMAHAGQDGTQAASPAPGPASGGAIVAADAARTPHHHGSGRGCSTDGSCCDAFCHAVMAVSVPGAGAVIFTFASYRRSDDAGGGSVPVIGPERPPRTALV